MAGCIQFLNSVHTFLHKFLNKHLFGSREVKSLSNFEHIYCLRHFTDYPWSTASLRYQGVSLTHRSQSQWWVKFAQTALTIFHRQSRRSSCRAKCCLSKFLAEPKQYKTPWNNTILHSKSNFWASTLCELKAPIQFLLNPRIAKGDGCHPSVSPNFSETIRYFQAHLVTCRRSNYTHKH